MNIYSICSKLFGKTLPDGFFEGVADIHSHILPGVDDGARNIVESKAMIDVYRELGFSGFTITPHFMQIYENSRGSVSARYNEVFKKLDTKGLKSRLAAEYMLDDKFFSHSSDGWMTIDGAHLVLVETSYFAAPKDMGNMLYTISLEGYKPVIAHPERYRYADEYAYLRWKRKGYLFQLNLLSLSGAYGKLEQDKAAYMLHKGMFDFVGTDMHNAEKFLQWRAGLKLTVPQIDRLRKLFENNNTVL